MCEKESNMTPVTFDSFEDTCLTFLIGGIRKITFDSFRDTHLPARTNANVPARSRSGLDHEKKVKYDARHI